MIIMIYYLPFGKGDISLKKKLRNTLIKLREA